MAEGSRPPLDLDAIDLATLADALEDHSTEWWFDPATGRLEPWSDAFGDEFDEGHPDERAMRHVEPIPSHEAYGDMEDFIAMVSDPRASDLLARAIAGRGAFRRFKDTLAEFPDLRAAWFELHGVRMERRALEWLADEGFLPEDVAARPVAQRPDPMPIGASTDAGAEAARELRPSTGIEFSGLSCTARGRAVTPIRSRTSTCSSSSRTWSPHGPSALGSTRSSRA